MGSAHNDPTPTLLDALTEVVQKLEDSRLDVGYVHSIVETFMASLTFIGGHATTVHRR